LLAGLSYSFGPYAALSVDYQYDAYRSTKLNDAPTDPGYTNGVFHNDLRGVHTIRAGVEVKPTPWLSLRVGGGYKSKVLNETYNFIAFSEPVADMMWYASAGVGFRISEVTSIDLAYQYRNTRYSDYYSFYTDWSDKPNESPLYGLDLINHNIALTFAFRF
jgi:long-subunit fatty acid transport protein